MLSRRPPIERPPSKIAGAVYAIIGFFALCVAAFVLLYQGVLGPVTNFRTGFGIVIALYGLFRIYTGITMIRKANRMKGSLQLDGSGQEPKPPVA
ncbi:MAG TPA: hypothetical protein VFH95_06320 [Candidatus Kapabacteria bacterium]|nr:hypothetical protein [Candidatus Kapabacteria bacterium]